MNILVTGGTGSLGRALTKLLLKDMMYDRICIYSRDEHKQEQMAAQFNNSPYLRFFVGDTRDRDRLDLACRGIDVIIHAAALKIVPAMEYNPFEAVKTNIMGTQNVIDCAIKHGVNNVMLMSTDKAVHPINLYGATKLCAEKLFIAANNINGPGYSPHFSVVRYGNVANSNGSIIPKFVKQVAAGEPLTVTDDRMSRFWITLADAAAFVLHSSKVMRGAEIFVPNMQTFKVMDLAKAFCHPYDVPHYESLDGKKKVIVTGIRPGEKLDEEIITAEEMPFTTNNNDKCNDWVIRPLEPPNYIDRDNVNLASNSNAVERLDVEDLRVKLQIMGVI